LTVDRAAYPRAGNLDHCGDNAALVADGDARLMLQSNRAAVQQIVMSSGVLTPDNSTLAELIGARKALFVITPSIDRLYGRALRAYISSVLERSDSEVFVLNVTETTKNLGSVDVLAAQASGMGLYRRGVPNIKVPTTLVGLIDAGIGTKQSVNHNGYKSLLGTFSAPEASLLDASFLATLPDRHLRTGLAEMFKMAVIDDRGLFELLEAHGEALVRSKFQAPHSVAAEVVKRSVSGMLHELSLNLYEQSRQRKVDFGHTFSPYVETASKHRVLHGEAVAIDIAISAEIAASLGLLVADDLEILLRALTNLGLPSYWDGIVASDMYASLESIRLHRSGSLHLVVPSGIGSCVFLEDEGMSAALLDTCLRRLALRGTGVLE
jgi:3-dehydroquinate synthetase